MQPGIYLTARLALLCLILTISCETRDSAPPADLVIQNVTVVDAQNGERSNQTVVIQGHLITEVLPAGQVTNFEEANVIDGTGKFLIPGLWDTHVHLSFEPDLAASMFRLFIGYGITSVRDTGGQLDKVIPWKKESIESPKASPRVMVAGPLLDGVPTVYDGSSPGRPHLGIGAATPEEAEALVDEFISAGVDLIKSYEMLSPEAFGSVISRATQYGKVVTGHVPLSMDVVEASNLGLRSMEHMRNLEMACSKDYDSLKVARLKMLEEGAEQLGGDLRSSLHAAQRIHAYQTQDSHRREQVLTVLAENGTWQTPTLSIISVGTRRPFLEKSWAEAVESLPETVRSRWTKGAGEFGTAPIQPTSEKMTAWALEMIRHMKKANVVMMAGTDTPIAFLIPGFSLHNELALLVEGGLSPMEALESATLRPAEYFGMQDSLGTIGPGKIADLVLLDANPLEDIQNTKTIRMVVKDGALHDRMALNAMLKSEQQD